MKNYNNSKIYKIQPTCEHDEGDIYIGSTNRQYLCQRMAAHKHQYKQYKKGSTGKVMSFDIFDKYGPENVKITLIETVNANSKDELLSREAYYIRNTNCINKYIPLRTTFEYHQDNKEKINERHKQYRDQNKEKISEQKKQYYEDNKDKISEHHKQYYEDNKDKISEQQKQYYEDNKDKIKEYHEKNKEMKKQYNKQYYANQKLKKTIEI